MIFRAQPSWLLLSLALAGLVGSAQVTEVHPAMQTHEEKLRLERERILAGVSPHWADLRSLVEASREEAKARTFLSAHSRLAEKYSSPTYFLEQLQKWNGRLLPLPQDVHKIDPARIQIDFLRSGERETVVLTFRTPGQDEFIRLNGTYFDGELSSVNITKGFATPYFSRNNSRGDFDTYRGRRY
jgi:hypothetical protein